MWKLFSYVEQHAWLMLPLALVTVSIGGLVTPSSTEVSVIQSSGCAPGFPSCVSGRGTSAIFGSSGVVGILGVAMSDATAATLDESAASVSAQGSPVRLLTLVCVPTDEVLFGVFAADGAQIVAQACRRAGIPAQRLTAAVNTRITSVNRGETPGSPAAITS